MIEGGFAVRYDNTGDTLMGCNQLFCKADLLLEGEWFTDAPIYDEWGALAPET